MGTKLLSRCSFKRRFCLCINHFINMKQQNLHLCCMNCQCSVSVSAQSRLFSHTPAPEANIICNRSVSQVILTDTSQLVGSHLCSYASVLARTVAGGIMLFGLSVHPSARTSHYCEHDISKPQNLFKFSTIIHFDSMMNWIDISGQRSLWLINA